jgi:pilus assembly protein Flp/PilA
MSASAVMVDAETRETSKVVRRRGERGQGMVEYAFIILLVAIVVLISVVVLGRQTSNLYSNISSGLNS